MPKLPTSTQLKLTPSNVRRLRQQAKNHKKLNGCSHAEALEHVARENGSPNWKAILHEANIQSKLSASTPAPSRKFIVDDDIQLSESDVHDLRNERSDDLDNLIKLQVAKNRAFLARRGIEYSIFEPTLTGLKKSILDATQPVRIHFKLTKFHDFSEQKQGGENKVINHAFFVSEQDDIVVTKVSLYRPNTKHGDPRMWFSKLGGYFVAGDQIAVMIFKGGAYLVNLGAFDFDECDAAQTSFSNFISDYCDSAKEMSNELLEKLREIAKKPLPAVNSGDTAIGMSIEHALGIKANSSKQPDYKGIEIKAGRGGNTRTTLFAQVADWGRSTCKSSAEILDSYGYAREDAFKLYCTISARKVNSQGLSFEYSADADELNEIHDSGKHVATWTGDLLRRRMEEKHAETFWIHAASETVNGKEYFHLKSVVHTKSPLLNQLMPLIGSGVITMDHLIKRTCGKKPRVSEKGPLFKMNKTDLSLLFPEPIKYSLVEESV